MIDNFSAALRLVKPAMCSEHGVVVAQHRRAAEVGAAVLARGGDAVDASIATSFALGVLEPWMSGIGGGGAMVLYRAAQRRICVIDFGMRAPASLEPDDYPLSGRGVASDLFPWAHVVDDRNVHGPLAVAVPGTVDGMRIAHERFARLPWAELVAPAVDLADAGLLVDWFTTEGIASAAVDLRRYQASAQAFLVDGLPPTPAWSARTQVRLPQGGLARTLERLAAAGARDFYEGDLARTIAGEMQAAGGRLTPADLAAYRAREVDPLIVPYRHARVFATPELTAGPTLARTLRTLAQQLTPAAAPDAAAYAAYAHALQEAYAFRLHTMGDIDGGRAPGCTTHFCVVDRDGNMAAVTQTLLSLFGSRFMLPESGVLMNNGIMWFDPEPGRANSLAPGKRCLTNYCPIIVESGDTRFALGASGGRRILPAVTQLLSFLCDYGMSLNDAFHLPRIDASEGRLLIGDAALPEAVHAALSAQFEYVRMRRQSLPFKFACPSAVLRSASRNWAASEPGSPWADAIASGPAVQPDA
ncbi:MAG: gamma-glutamyltransferase [Burkholderiales bacterium]|nr:gamma-glutamyltransferase [Burkholderiales bacterium]